MARNETLEITGRTWVQLTNADTSTITLQNQGPGDLFVVATTSATTPTSTSGAIRYKDGEGESNAALADLFPGVSSGVRVYAFAGGSRQVSGGACSVFVSHA